MPFITPGMPTPNPENPKPTGATPNYKAVALDSKTGEKRTAGGGFAIYKDRQDADDFCIVANDPETGVQANLYRQNPNHPDLNPDLVYIVEETYDRAPSNAEKLAHATGMPLEDAKKIFDVLEGVTEIARDDDPNAGPGAGYGEHQKDGE